MLDIIKEENLNIPTFLIPIIKKLDLELNDCLLLIYFWNHKNTTFDPLKIKKVIKLKEEEILVSFNNLISKNLIKLDMVKDEFNKLNDVVNLEYLYMLISDNFKNAENKQKKEDIYTIFEREMGITLSSNNFEYINNWLEKNFSEELIIGALKQSLLYNAKDFRYIDKVLSDWKMKGYKTMEDVNNINNVKIVENNELYKRINEIDYNWIDEE